LEIRKSREKPERRVSIVINGATVADGNDEHYKLSLLKAANDAVVADAEAP